MLRFQEYVAVLAATEWQLNGQLNEVEMIDQLELEPPKCSLLMREKYQLKIRD